MAGSPGHHGRAPLRGLWAGMTDRERQAVVADAGLGPTKQELAAQWNRDPTVVSHTLRALRRRLAAAV